MPVVLISNLHCVLREWKDDSPSLVACCQISIECARYNLSGEIYSIISSTARDFGLTNKRRPRFVEPGNNRLYISH